MGNVGTLQFGQTRDVVVRMALPPGCHLDSCVKATVTYKTRAADAGAAQIQQGVSAARGAASGTEVQEAVCRLTFVDAMRKIMKCLKLTKLDIMQGKTLPLGEAAATVQALERAIASSPAAGSDRIQGLLEDIHGQVAEAVSQEGCYTKWGQHYLPSLMNAHLAELRNNFKDPGVQGYGGELFEELQEKAEEIFLALPAPTPTTRPRPPPSAPSAGAARTSFVSTTPYRPAPASMNNYMDRYAG